MQSPRRYGDLAKRESLKYAAEAAECAAAEVRRFGQEEISSQRRLFGWADSVAEKPEAGLLRSSACLGRNKEKEEAEWNQNG